MAITKTDLAGAVSTTDATSYATASITPTANRLVLLCVRNRKVGGGDIPTATGNGLTYVNIGTVMTNGGTQRLTIFRALGASPSGGAITIDFGGITQTAATWSVVEFGNVDYSGTNGDAAALQPTVSAAGQSGTSLTVTLAAFSNVLNGTFGFFWHPINEASVEGDGFTAIHNLSSAENGNNLFTEWKATNDTTVDATWATSVGVNEAKAFAVEIAHFPSSSSSAAILMGA